jgi:hypothetical protein
MRIDQPALRRPATAKEQGFAGLQWKFLPLIRTGQDY